MKREYSGITVKYTGGESDSAAKIFEEEMRLRNVSADGENPLSVVFAVDSSFKNKDEYAISSADGSITFTAKGVRGLIFAQGEFLRNTEYSDNRITLVRDICGRYSPYMSIRGHQLGYRDTPNTYDAWDIEDYVRYYKDLMFFGVNTVEHIPYDNGVSCRNEIMKYDEVELAAMASEEADKLDLDVSLWMPNCEKDFSCALKHRERVFSELGRIDAVFPPGGDPGTLDAEEMFARDREYYGILKKYHPDAKIWPSAQEPRGKENWGGKFIEELEKLPEEIGGVIQGPNRAFTTDELRRKVPMRFPLRFYPDITHNVRCEHPVHFLEDDWNYALCTVNGRESFNPRPVEYSKLHRLTYKYFEGSVSYSEGVNDDVNKAVWSALDFNPDKSVREIVEEYARLYFYGADIKKTADGILGLEKNWEGRPEDNPSIDYVYNLFQELGNDYPFLQNNWRYMLCMFRAATDKFAKDKLIYEKSLLADAKMQINAGKLSYAYETLFAPLPKKTTEIRKQIDTLAGRLFETIGIQLGTRDYHASGWERGAVLDIIDLPVTDLPVIRNKLEAVKDKPFAVDYMKAYLDRNKVGRDEFYFSFALNELYSLGERQTPDFYMDFQGDRPDKNKGYLPVCLFKLYDHFSLKCKTAGFTQGTSYILMITYKDSPNTATEHHKITANGKLIYEGVQFGGERNADFERDMLPEGYAAVMYELPPDVLENGCLSLEISEPQTGFEIAEFRITKEKYKSRY